MAQTKSRPWWLYFLYAGTDVLGRVISTRYSADGRDGREHAGGINVKSGDILEPGIDPRRITSTTIIGQRIMGSDGKELGKIEEVALDLAAGSISYFVLAVGGFLGFGDKFFAIPLASLTLNPEDKTFRLNLSKKRLKKLTGFDKGRWPKTADWTLTGENTKREV